MTTETTRMTWLRRIVVAGCFTSAAVSTGAVAAPRDACADRALKVASASARDSDKGARLESFMRVEPTAAERGAADAFFEARFKRRGSDEILKYRVFMLCEGMVRPATLAIQQKYD